MNEESNNLETKILRKKVALGYTVLFGIFYLVIPLFFMGENEVEKYKNLLAILTFISIISFSASLLIDFFPNFKKRYLVLNFNSFSWIVYFLYVAVVAVIIFTAGKIPIIAALQGASQSELFGYREGFLKERTGVEAALAYLITLIDSTFYPFVILFSFLYKKKYRYLFLGTFLFYSISFLEKGYFLKIAIPLFIYFYYKAKNKKTYLLISGGVMILLVSLMFLVSKFDSSEVVRNEPYFSILYTPTTILDAIFWRSVAVPILTAYQGLELFFSSQFNGNLLYGATSSLLSSIFGLERINFERSLYQSQFGGSQTGNANQYYLVEAFINYGYLGVILFSFLLGKIVKDFINTKNIAVICLIPLLFYNLFSAGLIGNLLSNGYLLFYLFIILVKVKN